MSFFERWLSPKRPEPAPAASRSIEIPQDPHAREEMFAGYLWPLELLTLQEEKKNLDDYAIVIQPPEQRKIDELQNNSALRAAVTAYRERQESQRKVA